MKFQAIRAAGVSVLLATLASYSSAELIIQEMGLFTYSDSFGSVYEHNEIGSGYSDFSDAGFDIQFENNLDADNFGTFSWTVTNTGAGNLTDLTTSLFWDAELSQYDNSFTNETGEYVGNTTASSWEIDEPGYTSGDLIWNMLDFGMGDNTNALDGAEDDVAFSLGFFLDSFNIGDFFELTFEVSETDIGGLRHVDVDTNEQYFLNGFLTFFAEPDVAAPIDVPEPASILLFCIGAISLIAARRKKVQF